MVMFCCTTEMRMDYGRAVGDVGVRKHADACIVAAEYQQKTQCQICPFLSHLK